MTGDCAHELTISESAEAIALIVSALPTDLTELASVVAAAHAQRAAEMIRS